MADMGHRVGYKLYVLIYLSCRFDGGSNALNEDQCLMKRHETLVMKLVIVCMKDMPKTFTCTPSLRSSFEHPLRYIFQRESSSC